MAVAVATLFPGMAALFLCGVVALFLLGGSPPRRGAPPRCGSALSWRVGVSSLARRRSLHGAVALFLSVKALFICGMLAFFMRAADPLLGAALLLGAVALSLLGAVALSLGAVVIFAAVETAPGLCLCSHAHEHEDAYEHKHKHKHEHAT